MLIVARVCTTLEGSGFETVANLHDSRGVATRGGHESARRSATKRANSREKRAKFKKSCVLRKRVNSLPSGQTDRVLRMKIAAVGGLAWGVVDGSACQIGWGMLRLRIRISQAAHKSERDAQSGAGVQRDTGGSARLLPPAHDRALPRPACARLPSPQLPRVLRFRASDCSNAAFSVRFKFTCRGRDQDAWRCC
eukprot:5085049-Prymnesium_polylepis.1